MATYTISQKAYLKIFFHVAKHPHKPVNGVLLGTQNSRSVVEIDDAIPLLHHWTSLSPMMEIGLDLANLHAESLGLRIVGYYQACERLDDTALAPVGERVASKIRESFKDAIAFVINGETIGSDDSALLPYIPSGVSSSWTSYSGEPAPFTPGSSFQLASQDIPSRAAFLVRDEKSQEKFGDFDDHLENVSIDWLRNKMCLPAGL